MIKILPCPFCGGEGFLSFETVEVEEDWEKVNYFFVECMQCASRGGESSSVECVVDKWNARTPQKEG